MPETIVARPVSGLVVVCLSLAFLAAGESQAQESSSRRLTPLVRAVQEASPSVVNIQGQKSVPDTAVGKGAPQRQVNGMGTGVVIDPRGYILTNHHVVEGVRQINVTFADRSSYVAQLVAFDRRTDLAVIKVSTGRDLPVIRIGTSADLMPAESVIAVGNAFGYENTVTVGIISALHRDVQVSDTQSYDDLIQTDASINPGNSGGPLLNIDGEMIGVNVAVRAGAQGIGFAIPVDSAMEVAASLLSVEEVEKKRHGVLARTLRDRSGVKVEQVAAGSPADACGLKPGDVIVNVAGVESRRRLDFERALIGRGNQATTIEVRRGGEHLVLDLSLSKPSGYQLASSTRRETPRPSASRGDTRAWDLLGVALEPEPLETFTGSKYQGGLRVVDVRAESPAAREGIQPGDILVGMHRWQTASLQDVDYIINRSNVSRLGGVRFYIMRGSETLYGDIDVASAAGSSGVRR